MMLVLPGSREGEVRRLSADFGEVARRVLARHPQMRIIVPAAAPDVALAASGTVSVELAAARTPMVIAYRMNWLSFRLIRTMALVYTVTLVNLVSDTRAVPEFLGPECKPDAIAEALCATIEAPGAQLAAMDETMARLGRGAEAPGLRAARAVLKRLSS